MVNSILSNQVGVDAASVAEVLIGKAAIIADSLTEIELIQ